MKNLEHLNERAADFVTKPGQKYLHQGVEHDLSKVDIRTAEALANDPNCKFLQWADLDRRPKGQDGNQLQKFPLPHRPSKKSGGDGDEPKTGAAGSSGGKK